MAAPTFAPALGLVDAAGVPISASNPLSVSLVAGGGGTAVSIADGADVTLGSLADSSSALTVNGLLKAIKALLGAPLAVTGSFYQATQPVSGSVTANAGTGTFAVSAIALPLPDGAATSALQTTGNTSLANLDVALSTLSLKNQFPTTLGITTKAASLSVAIASDQVGTAGSASTTVMSVQGVASMTPVQVSQATASNLLMQAFGGAATGAAVSGNPVLTAGKDSAGNARPVALDPTGKPDGSSFYYQSGIGGQPSVKSDAGVLRAVWVGAATATSKIDIYDSLTNSGTVILSITATGPTQFTGPLKFSTGLSINTTVASASVTLIYD